MSKNRLILGAVACSLAVYGIYFSSGDCSRSKKFIVNGDSMSGIFEHGQNIRARYGYYSCHEPVRNEIVVVKYGGDPNPLLKQIRGVPGDSLSFAKDKYADYLVLNKVPLMTTKNKFFYVDSNAKKLLSGYLLDGKIRKEAYLILGNQPVGSIDSRDFGLLGIQQFLGVVPK